MIVYTRKEYCEKYGMHHNTLRNRIANGTLPSFHKVKHLDGRGVVIIVDQCELCNATEKAMREYCQRAGGAKNAEIATEIAIKYDLKVSKMFRMIGL